MPNMKDLVSHLRSQKIERIIMECLGMGLKVESIKGIQVIH
jgi:hypothetical protein